MYLADAVKKYFEYLFVCGFEEKYNLSNRCLVDSVLAY